MADEFWPDHQVRCTICGRQIPLPEARADGWKAIEDLTAEASNLVLIHKGRCWRCDREARAREMSG